MPAPLIRILSDVHFGDRASRVTRLAQLRPLLDGADHLVLNGDTLDTRAGPQPAHTAETRAAVADFFPRHVGTVTLLTGNHDPDISAEHEIELGDGIIWVTHGDVFFDDIVPWGNDAPLIRTLLADTRQSAPPHPANLETRFEAFRRVAASIPQRHQSERDPLKYTLSFLGDTAWPPQRILRVLRAWRDGPALAAAMARRHRPQARWIVCGHTHRPGITRPPGGPVVINTGSFCPPFGARLVDILPDHVVVHEVRPSRGEFRRGPVVAEFPLAQA
ncbi:MAG: metallophosphoesterase family protein [Opitutaceae bacterium]|nr:metallophosphoesterase family protein [Opitutaceae bacterium]